MSATHPTKIRLLVELSYDSQLFHGDDPESIEWFHQTILSEKTGELLLHSNEIGDTVGEIEVLSIISDEPTT